MQGVRRSDWRDMGCSFQLELHGDQTFGFTLGSCKCSVLADPARCIAGPECSARTLACRVTSCSTTSSRCASAGVAALVARIVPLASLQDGPMDGNP